MESTSPTAMTVEAAHQLLKQFDCLTPGASLSHLSKQSIQDALVCVVRYSDYQILGICADSWAEGQATLQSYATALGYTLPSDTKPGESPHVPDGAVYIKFNPKANILYIDSYSGDHRGVLVSCQSAYGDRINDMYGHLPLTLFD